ncbi:MAG: hypothetical protein D6705_00995 [Deltaproteobacteria bacterium]|nr:MAG: hypothetical protein D6705_00995 [Deltaproteobacteria bacterium]
MTAWCALAFVLLSTGPAPTAPKASPQAPGAEATRADRLADPTLERLLLLLETRGFADARKADQAELEALLAAAQERYVRGDDFGSAALLYEALGAPRFAHLRPMPTFAAVEYHLGVALQSYGARRMAAAAFDAVLLRGHDGAYFGPALRRRVDVELARRDYAAGVAAIEDVLRRAGALDDLAPHEVDELDYLRGRARLAAGDRKGAIEALSSVGPTSRFRTAATYLTGVVHALERRFDDAEAAFCRVVATDEHDPKALLIDRRYFPVRDLAQLGLGRIAHERRRHLVAFYHYVQVPDDSDYIADALFESAWTLAERGEYRLARGTIEELRRRFPKSPQAVEARLLEALIVLHDCDFRRAEQAFTRLVDDLAPVLDHVETIRENPARLRALHEELRRLQRGEPISQGDLDAHLVLLGLLERDRIYVRLADEADAVAREAEFLGRVDRLAERALARLGEGDVAAAFDPQVAVADAAERARNLERAIAEMTSQLRRAEALGADADLVAAERERIAALRRRAKALRTRAVRALLEGAPVGSAQAEDVRRMLEDERRRLARLRAEAFDAAERLDAAAVTALGERLGRVRKRIDDLLGEARMGRIDAVLGAKKKLEIEVQDLAAGRFPPELFGTLELTGLLGEDEEYWPYEGEYWADEYEAER